MKDLPTYVLRSVGGQWRIYDGDEVIGRPRSRQHGIKTIKVMCDDFGAYGVWPHQSHFASWCPDCGPISERNTTADFALLRCQEHRCGCRSASGSTSPPRRSR